MQLDDVGYGDGSRSQDLAVAYNFNSMDSGVYKVYMLRCEDGSLYTGITTDVERRFAEHESGGPKAARYTRAHRPVGIEAVWVVGSRSAASAMERRVKLLTHAQKLELAANPELAEQLGLTAFGGATPTVNAARIGTERLATTAGEATIALVRDDFDLEKIANSGQCFRWEPMDDGSYRILSGSECVYVEDLGEGRFRFGCSDAEFARTWHDYLDLNANYSDIRLLIDPETDPFLWRASECQKGIRILRQDPWETLVSFIISQNKNIPAIRRSIEALCSIAGEQLVDARGLPYFGFPSPGAIASLSQDELLQCKLGYRWKYVRAAANAVLEREIDFEQLKQVDEKLAIGVLTGLYGVGVKVASCVALFGLHHTDAFPIDVWMKRVLENEYPHGYPFETYRPYNGVFQQYMFAHYRT